MPGHEARDGLRIFILPSWCPTSDVPLSGTFFVEQAQALAAARPEWDVGICLFDLGRSRLPWRPWQLPRFVLDWISNPRLTYRVDEFGLRQYKVWAPYAPSFGSLSKWETTGNALAMQGRVALELFVQQLGKPDLIHAQAVYPGGVAAVALGEEFGVPVGITEHLGPFPPATLCLADGQVMPVIAEAYARANGHSAVSRFLVNQIVSLRLARGIHVVPNFLADDYGSTVCGAIGNKTAPFTFLTVGGPSREKGTDLLLKALARMSAIARLRCVGSGPELPFYQRMAADLGVGERVSWLGSMPRKGMPDAYRACDAFVLPSRVETFGIAFIEALACGKPLIGTRCGGPEDIVCPENGLLVPIDDVEELALAMDRMVLESGNYMPEILHADFLARFSATAVAQRIEEWYVSLQSGVKHEAKGRHG